MVSILTIVSLAIATLLMVALIIGGVLMNRKKENFSRNLVVGLLTYFIGQMLFVASNQMLSGFNNGFIYLIARGISFVVAAALIIYAFKRFRNNPAPNALSLTFGYAIFTVFQSLIAFVSYFMVSFAVNKGQVAQAYPNLTQEQVGEIINQVTQLSALDVGLRVLLIVGIVVATSVAFKFITRYLYADKPQKIDVVKAIAVVLLMDLVPEFVSMISNKNVIVVSLSCVVVIGGLLFYSKKVDHEA